MAHPYIKPITDIYSSLAEAEEKFDTRSVVRLFRDEKALDIADLAQGTRNLVVGEPGVGKTLLLDKLKVYLENQGVASTLVNLRQSNAVEQMTAAVSSSGSTEKSRTLLLDGLDEVKASLFPDVLQLLQMISREHENMPIYLSSRRVFISRYANSFPEYRCIVISPFTRHQVREYLLSSGRPEPDVDALINRVMSLSQGPLVIQIPRYLRYLGEFLDDKGWEAASVASRNELFEHFIYAKLELEEEKLSANKRALTKRVLEKLALTMEIYQTNVISKDELMTFFDELRSDLKLVALAQIDVEAFYDYSLLRVSEGNLDKIEFENTEFQEYLAAKEITRFPDPSHAAFSFAVDPNVSEIYPTWYNTLTFLVEMLPSLLEQLLEFSGLRANKFKVMEETFIAFLSRLDPRAISRELRRQIFADVIAYQKRTLQWLPAELVQALSSFFDSTLTSYLNEQITTAEAEERDKRVVQLGNLLFVVAYLLKAQVPIDRGHWRDRLIRYSVDSSGGGVLQRYALLALQWLGDPTVVSELPNLMESDDLVKQAFLSALAELAPDEKESIDRFIEAVAQGDMHARYGLFAITTPTALEAFLRAFVENEPFRREFLEDSYIFRDRDHVIVEHLEPVLDDQLRGLCKEALVLAAHYDVAQNARQSAFIVALWTLLMRESDAFLAEMIRRIEGAPNGKSDLYFLDGLFARILEPQDVEGYISVMRELGYSHAAFGVMTRVALSERRDALEVYEAGRALLPEEYQTWEAQRETPQDRKAQQIATVMEDFHRLLEPEPGKWSPDVFQFFNQHAAEIEPILAIKDRQHLGRLVDNVIKQIDPSQQTLIFTRLDVNSREFTTSSLVFLFKEAIEAAHTIGFDMAPYRQRLLDFIPFADADDLKIIFEVARNATEKELTHVIETFRDRKSDVWQYNPASFIRVVERYHLTAAGSTLKSLISDSAWPLSARTEALPVLDSIAPDGAFLRDVFARYCDDPSTEEKKVADLANALLITNHSDPDALRWRLREVVARAARFRRQLNGVHAVGELESEILFGREFASPLRAFRSTGYEADYLGLLDHAMDIWAKGEDFHEYAGYLWEIVYAYFENLKEHQSYAPLQVLEAKITSIGSREGANWLAARMVTLRRSYVAYLGKPDNISTAVASYNSTRQHDPKRIRNSSDLFQQVQIAFDTDLRRWIEGEGAYNVIHHKIEGSGRQYYEDLVQKTVKTQIENALLKRSLRVEIVREPQLLDEKRVDLLVYYGFVGPIVIEVKLTSNRDIQGKKVDRSPSYSSMKRYMDGFGARHGILMVIDNAGAKNLSHVIEVFQSIAGVRVSVFDCPSPESAKAVKSR